MWRRLGRWFGGACLVGNAGAIVCAIIDEGVNSWRDLNDLLLSWIYVLPVSIIFVAIACLLANMTLSGLEWLGRVRQDKDQQIWWPSVWCGAAAGGLVVVFLPPVAAIGAAAGATGGALAVLPDSLFSRRSGMFILVGIAVAAALGLLVIWISDLVGFHGY